MEAHEAEDAIFRCRTLEKWHEAEPQVPVTMQLKNPSRNPQPLSDTFRNEEESISVIIEYLESHFRWYNLEKQTLVFR